MLDFAWLNLLGNLRQVLGNLRQVTGQNATSTCRKLPSWRFRANHVSGGQGGVVTVLAAVPRTF